MPLDLFRCDPGLLMRRRKKGKEGKEGKEKGERWDEGGAGKAGAEKDQTTGPTEVRKKVRLVIDLTGNDNLHNVCSTFCQ